MQTTNIIWGIDLIFFKSYSMFFKVIIKDTVRQHVTKVLDHDLIITGKRLYELLTIYRLHISTHYGKIGTYRQR